MKRHYPGSLIDYYASISIGGKAVIVAPLKKQPPEGWRYEDTMILNNGEVYGVFRNKVKINLKAPFPIGATVGMPETWVYCCRSNKAVMYKRDNYCKGIGEIVCLFTDCSVKWRSPATMPNSAIRLFWKVTGTRVCRVQDLPYEEGLYGGSQSGWFTSRYSTPRPIVRAGEIIGYRCFKWGWETVMKGQDKYLLMKNNIVYWKGKPLEIIVNPWMEVSEVERIAKS